MTAQLLGDLYFSSNNTDKTSGTVTFSNTGIVLGGDLIVTGASGTDLVGLNGESFTATQGTFFIGDSKTITVNSFTFTDASDGYVSELIYNGAESKLTLAGAMTASGTFSNATFTLANSGTYKINADTFVAKTDGSGTANALTFIDTNITVADSFAPFNSATELISSVTGYSAGSNITLAKTAIEIASGTAQLLGGYYFGGKTASGTWLSAKQAALN